MRKQKYPPGWDDQRVRKVLRHYDEQTEDEQCAEIERELSLLDLQNEYERIKDGHTSAIKKTAARIVLGPSVMRVYAKGTREALLPILARINIDALRSIRDLENFSVWFDEQVEGVARAIRRCNHDNPRITPGDKWGHATKIVALYVTAIVLGSHYFPDGEANRLSYFLYVPVDGVVMRRLKELGIRLCFNKIKDIDSRDKFYHVQDILARAADHVGVPRVWFDDNWGDRQKRSTEKPR